MTAFIYVILNINYEIKPIPISHNIKRVLKFNFPKGFQIISIQFENWDIN